MIEARRVLGRIGDVRETDSTDNLSSDGETRRMKRQRVGEDEYAASASLARERNTWATLAHRRRQH